MTAPVSSLASLASLSPMSPMSFAWGAETLVASTILMAAVLLLRGPVRRAFGPDVAYALWALPLLRMLLPPLPAAWRQIAATPISAASETITVYVTAPLGAAAAANTTAATATPAFSPADAVPVLAGLWLAGSVLFLGWHALQHRRFCRRMLDQQIRGSEIDGGIRLIETAAASGPLAFGVVRRYVAFPRDFVERYDQDERDLALAHELGHHARGDLIANWAALGVLALHWFNPVAWRAFRAFRADQEIANDARVLAGLSAVARHTYACAIVKSAHGGAVSAACHLHTINDLKGRLTMLTTSRTSRARLIGGAAAVAVLALAGLGLTASGTQAAETMRTTVERATGVTLAPPQSSLPVPVAPFGATTPPTRAELPVPPAAPAAAAAASADVPTARHGTGHRDDAVPAGLDTLAEMPVISAGACAGAGDTTQTVVNEAKGGRQHVIVCTDRIERLAAESAKVAADGAQIKRDALRSAIAGLRGARAGIDGNPGMTAEQRAAALEDIDDAIREVTEEMASAD